MARTSEQLGETVEDGGLEAQRGGGGDGGSQSNKGQFALTSDGDPHTHARTNESLICR